MKKIKLILVLMIISLQGFSQVLPQLYEIPRFFTNEQKLELLLRKEKIMTDKELLKANINSFNTRCGSVPAVEKERVRQCEIEQANMGAMKKDLVEAINAFNDMIRFPGMKIKKEEQPVIGTPSLIVGDVRVRRNGGREWVIKPGIPLRSGDIIITGPDSKLQVLLVDKTAFTVGMNSELLLDDFVYDTNNGIVNISARILKGAFRFITGKVAKRKPDAMQVTTSVIAIGIRGTNLQVNVLPDSSGSVFLYDGLLQITEKGSGRKIDMVAGQMLYFSSAGKCSGPVPLLLKKDEEL